MPKFVPGLKLCKLFYQQEVTPILNRNFPKLRYSAAISDALSDQLPYEFMGHSTNFSEPEPNGVRHPVRITRGRIDHMVNIYTVRSFFKARLGFDPHKEFLHLIG